MSSQAAVPDNVPSGGGTNPLLAWAGRNARIVAPLITLVVEIIFFSFATDNFMSSTNLKNVISAVGPVAVAATGITFVLLCAEIDLSIASISVTVRRPPPTVSGMKHCSAVAATTSCMILRSSLDAVISRKISSSAP